VIASCPEVAIMRCDDCGCDIPPGQEVETTRSEQQGTAGPLGAGTSTEVIKLCPACARRRGRWGWVATLIVAVLFFGGLAVLIGELMRH
jgi:hypothetical protein